MNSKSPSQTADILSKIKKIQEILTKSFNEESPNLIIQNILEENAKLLNADSATIVLWDSELGIFNNIYNIDPKIAIRGLILNPEKDGLDCRLARDKGREIIELSNYSKNMDAYDLLKPLNFTNALGVSLKINEKELIGTMCFYFLNRQEKIDSSLKILLKEIAFQTSIAIKVARLFQDLDSSKTSEEQAYDLLDLLMNSSPEIIINLDLTGKIIYWNNSAEKSFLFSASEMMGQKLPLVYGLNEENFLKMISDVRKGEKVIDQNLFFYRKNSQNKKSEEDNRLVKIILVPIINKRGEIESILLTGKDISENKQLKTKMTEVSNQLNKQELELSQKEELLHQTQQELLIAEKLATIGNLSGKLNHQINNPLMIILTYLSIIKDDLDEMATEYKGNSSLTERLSTMESQIDSILMKGNRIKNVLKELRFYSEITKEIHFRKNTNIVEVVTQTYEKIKTNNENLNFELKISSKQQWGNIYGNFQQLSYVFIQIFNNAIIATHNHPNPANDGLISIHISSIKLNQKNHIRVKITDNGIGIGEKQIENLFEPFYSGWYETDIIDPDATDKQHIGLSLATAKTILQNHNAKISVKTNVINSKDSKPSGTVFTIDFPEI